MKLTVLGEKQLIGGILIAVPRTRRMGAMVMTVTFVIAAVAVFANGMIAFGLVSVLFVEMAVVIITAHAQKRGLEEEMRWKQVFTWSLEL